MLGRPLHRLAAVGLPLVTLFGLHGCAGTGNAGHKVMEFAYVATGSDVAQFEVSDTGQLTPLSPASVTSGAAVDLATTGKYLFAANSSGTVSQFTVDNHGTLAAMNPPTVAAGANPTAVAVTPSAKFLYVLNQSDDTIEQYSVGTGGLLTTLSPATVPTAAQGVALTISPNGKFLYAMGYSSNTIDAYSIGGDGQLSPLSVPSYTALNPTRAAFSPNGNFLYVSQSTAGVAEFSVGADGSLTPLNPASVPAPAAGLITVAVAPNGDFLYAGCFNGGVAGSPVGQYAIGADGTVSPLTPPSAPAGNAPTDVVVNSSEQFVYVANLNDGTVSEFSINADGTLSALTPATVSPGGAHAIVLARR